MLCCIIGHRKIFITEFLIKQIKETLISLIVNGVDTFLFGSNSQFNKLCYNLVTELKNTRFPHIKRVLYSCKSESAILDEELRQKLLKVGNFSEDSFPQYESEVEHKNKYNAGKASYIERNFAMIDASDYCLFYYNKNYLPPERKYNKRALFTYQPKSGTKLAYNYATKKKKHIINIFNN